MRIEELILEGFKSYPVRTQITGWDSSFNAITGLNGSGKSNILDAICFVLGITNMQSMRVQNQTDLIYKRGQAGVTKASVTIVFDNSDRDKSPVGLENYKQITVTRQIALPNVSKYLLNGHKTQQHTVQTLFQSVQLNINNPNFLIMQGRITKVLNMRPPEILGMVEEAAGTRMFEERKEKARKTMEKKQARVDSIVSTLEEEIAPKLDRLREEKRSFLEYQKAISDSERLGRLLRAWEWTDAGDRVIRKEAEMEKKAEDIANTKKQKERLGKECKAAEAECEKVKKRREAEMKKGGKFKQREEEVQTLEKELVKLRTQADIKKSTIDDEEKRASGLQTEAKELEDTLTAKRQEVEGLQASFAKVKEKHDAAQDALTTSEDLLQSLLTGLSKNKSDSAGAGGGYMGQLADAQARLAHAQAEEEQTRTKLGMAEKEAKALEQRWKAVEREAADGTARVERLGKELEGLKTQLDGCGWTEEKERLTEENLQKARGEVRRFTQECDGVKGRFSNLNFDYTAPSPNFDHSKVKGLVATLVSLDRNDYDKATALEITAGARLYNVVVQDERVGKDLLQNGRLRKRVTIIPLNKINAHTMAPQKLQAAQRLAPGKIRLALSLVGYPDEVSKAMSYVFGETLICDDAASAKAATFSREVSARSITLDGDVYDPSGTLSGGAAPSGSGVLVKVQELLQVEARLREAKETLDALERQARADQGVRERWTRMKRDVDIKEHELNLLAQQVEGSNAARVGIDLEAQRKAIEDLKAMLQAAQEKQVSTKEECQKLQRDMEEFKNNKDGKINELKADVSKRKAELQKFSVTVKTQQKEMQTGTLELEQMEKDIEAAKEAVKECQACIEKIRKEAAKLEAELSKEEAKHAEAVRKLQEERAILTQFDNELKDLEDTIKEKKQAMSDSDLALTKLEHDLQTLGKERTAAINVVSNWEQKFPWITDEKELFGKPNTPYDFGAQDMNRVRTQVAELEGKQKTMKKKINHKVLNMIEGVEKRESELKKNLATVMQDKKKIEETIEELDRYKKDALEKTWEKVNGDFGGIFAELLPGNFAKLEPPEGKDVTDGLEVKVRLGPVWKQSLTELSGGQRSLIALSLIMSLLQFKPAPMYILDEIDAALDLSHTQHIGQLFRTRFHGAQFIVVSLKEGLFTNANVLFRTRFRDGTSVVERTAQRSTSTLYQQDGRRHDGGDKENEGTAAGQPGRRKK